MKLQIIKREKCECGARMVMMKAKVGQYSERAGFECGLELYVTGGNPTNYSIREWTPCRNSPEIAARRERWLAAKVALYAAVDATALTVEEKLELKGRLSCEIDWRVR